MSQRRLATVALATVAILAHAAPARSQATSIGPAPSTTTLTADAYAAAFNLDHDRGIALARQAVAEAPSDARAHRTLAAMLWIRIIFERGAITTDHYARGMSDAQKHLPRPDAELDRELHAELSRAIELAEARLKTHPDDLEVRYEVGAAYGLQASYTATIGGSLSGAFRTAKGAFDAQEKVLEGQPDHALANVTVGTYRYLVSTLGLASRWFAYIVGFGGGKERGIGMIERASTDPGARVEAGTSLMLIYSREGRHEDAYRVALALADAYPGNRLFVLEAGSAAVRAGLGAEAERLLSAGIERLPPDEARRAPGERAIWLYQLGQARLSQRRPGDARRSYQAALEADPQGWWSGRIRAGLGKTADLAGQRDVALAEYAQARSICEALDDNVCRDEVRQLQRRPFSSGERRLR